MLVMLNSHSRTTSLNDANVARDYIFLLVASGTAVTRHILI